jgi:hypothetical protein
MLPRCYRDVTENPTELDSSPGLRDVTEQPVELLLKVDLSACATDEARATAHLQASKALTLADLPAV